MKFTHFLAFIGALSAVICAGYGLARMDISLRAAKSTAIAQTIQVRGTNPTAPIPIEATLELHSDGRVTWRRPK